MEEKIIQKPIIKRFKKSFSLLALYLGEKIDLKKVQEKLKKYPYISREHPIILKLGQNQYAVLTKFGTVTFWNVSKNLRNEFIREISPFIENFNQELYFSDVIKVLTGKEIEDVKFGKVYLTKIDKEKVQIISLALSQSVALERYETEIEERVSEMERIINTLREGSFRNLKEKYLLNQIGDIIAVRQKTISHLSLLDKPETAWERLEIEKLYDKLYFEFDLHDRIDILNEKIKFLSDHHKILLDFISAQRSNFLEMIIIFLITIEILIFFFEVFGVPRLK